MEAGTPRVEPGTRRSFLRTILATWMTCAALGTSFVETAAANGVAG